MCVLVCVCVCVCFTVFGGGWVCVGGVGGWLCVVLCCVVLLVNYRIHIYSTQHTYIHARTLASVCGEYGYVRDCCV